MCVGNCTPHAHLFWGCPLSSYNFVCIAIMDHSTLNQETLHKLLEISRNMAENRELDPLLTFAVRVSLELFNAEYGYLILFKDGVLDFRVRQDKNGVELPQPDQQISHTILEKVIQKQESLIIADAILDPEFQTSQSVQALRLRSVMCVPLISRGVVLGAIYIENRSEKQLFTKNDLLPLQYFAAQAAISIENAFFNQDLEARVQQRTALYQKANARLQEEIKIRARIESQLRQLSSAIEQSPNSIIITNLLEEIEYVNPAFTHLTGYTFLDVRGKNPSFQKSGFTPAVTYAELWTTISAGKVWRGEFVNKKKNGEFYWEKAIIAPIRSAEGDITHYVAVKEDITERKQIEEELRRLAITDPLTGIYNRRHLFDLASRQFTQAARYDRQISAMMVDVDHFKQVNDRYGHIIGDRVLKQVADYFTEHIRTTDILGRYGGEEFLLILPETGGVQTYQMAERLLSHFHAHPIETNEGEIHITISIGISTYNRMDTPTIDRLIDHADQAMYEAKRAGRNQIALYSSNNHHDNSSG